MDFTAVKLLICIIQQDIIITDLLACIKEIGRILI